MPGIANAIKTKPRVATGGTTAPASAAKSYTTGLGGGMVAPNPGQLGQAQNLAPKANPAVAAAAAKPPAPTPWDTQYELTRGGAEKGYGDTVAGLGAKRTMTQQAYGIDPGFNDPAQNPLSRAAMLKKAWMTANRGSNTSFAARGQLYAGSLANARGANQSNYELGYDELNKSYLADLNQIDAEGARALEDKEGRISEAGWKRLEALQGAPLEPAPAPVTPKPSSATSKKYGKYGVGKGTSLGKGKKK